MTTRFDTEYERGILSKALQDPVFFAKAARLLDAHKFSSEQFTLIWKIAKANWRKHKELISKRLLLRKIHKNLDNEEDLESYVQTIKKIYKKKSLTAKIELEELETFVRFVDAQVALEKAINLMGEGKVEETYKVLRTVSQNQVKARDYTVVNWVEEFPQRLAELREQKENPDSVLRVPTGMRALDNVIGGVQAGELALIMGTTSSGKSMTLTNFAHGAITRGHKALYIALEMPARQIAMRQDARAFRILYDSFKYFNLTKADKKTIKRLYQKFLRRYAEMLTIVSMPLQRCDITVIEGLLDDLNEEQGFRPDVIFVDSGDHLNAIDKHRDYRLQQSGVYWDLKNFAEENQLAVWSSTQAGREWANKIATAEAASESYDKSRIADIVLSINRPNAASRSTKILMDSDQADDADLHDPKRYREMFLSKHRDGEAGVLVPLTASFEFSLLEELE